MQTVDCQLAINLSYCEDEIDSFITSCEEVINNFVENKSTAFKLKVAVHELIVNSVEHGYQKNSGRVNFFIERTKDDLIRLTVKDNGKGFNFDDFNLNRKNNSLDDIQPRGWGLLIINRLAKRLEFKNNTPTGTIVSVYIEDQI